VEITLVLQACRLPRRREVGGAGGRPFTRHLKQVCAYGVKSAVRCKPLIGLELSEQVKARLRASDHGNRDGVVECDDWIV
jgi:hypothetical protein